MKQRAATTRALRVFLGSCEGRSPCLKNHNIYEGIVPFTFSPRRIWSYCAFSRTGSRNLDSTVRKLNMCNVIEEKANGKDEFSIRNPKIIFVLGGPGSGKGTQCAMIVEHFGFTHLSAGDLLRDEIKSGSENGMMIQNIINEGNIVPSMVTVKLLKDAMRKSDNTKFLIDGFPRNDENRTTFEDETGIKPEFVLFFECTEQEMEKRLLGRNEGRLDDNIATIRKRFNVFVKSSLPVINHYESCGKVHKVNAVGRKEEVFEAVKPLFLPFSQKDA